MIPVSVFWMSGLLGCLLSLQGIHMGLPWSLLSMGILLGIPTACTSTVGNIEAQYFYLPGVYLSGALTWAHGFVLKQSLLTIL